MSIRLAGVRKSLREGVATAGLRRLHPAWGCSAVGSWTFFVALAVYAYHAGGATGVGLAALVRMVPAGLAAPLAGVLADRYSRRDVLFVSLIVRATILAGMALAIAGSAPAALVFALAASFTIVATAHKPAQAALLPTLAATPRQLAASNALWSGIDNAAFLAGSLIGGALVALASVQLAFAVITALFLIAALTVASIERDPVPSYRGEARASGALDATLRGFRAIAADRDLRLLFGFLSLGTLVEGAVDVLVVVVAIELLGLGGAGVGWLNAAWGVGGLAGGAAALVLLGRGRVAGGVTAGALLVGLPLMAMAAVSATAVAIAVLVAVGIGYALIEVAGLSLLQRLPSDEVLGRAFAALESSYWVTTGLGALAAPALVSLLGARGALLAAGAALPLVALARRRRLAAFAADAAVPEREFKALRELPVFAPVPMARVEEAARRVAAVRVPAGEIVVREGDRGDAFFVVASGELDVRSRAGAGALLSAGGCFGEVALLGEIPRTATVTARSDALLYSLDRQTFLKAVAHGS